MIWSFNVSISGFLSHPQQCLAIKLVNGLSMYHCSLINFRTLAILRQISRTILNSVAWSAKAHWNFQYQNNYWQPADSLTLLNSGTSPGTIDILFVIFISEIRTIVGKTSPPSPILFHLAVLPPMINITQTMHCWQILAYQDKQESYTKLLWILLLHLILYGNKLSPLSYQK